MVKLSSYGVDEIARQQITYDPHAIVATNQHAIHRPVELVREMVFMPPPPLGLLR